MSDFILTNNLFLKSGLECLKLTSGFKNSLVFIDLDSFQSLGDLLDGLINEGFTEDMNVFLIGSGCLNYKLLHDFEPIALNCSINQIKTILSTRKFHKLCELVRYISSIKRLSMLSSRERQCLLAFQKDDNVNIASKRMKISEKTLYALLRNAGIKINLKRLMQIREFLSSISFVLNER